MDSIQHLNSNDIINIILYQSSISNDFKVKLIEDNLFKIDKWDIEKIILNSSSVSEELKNKIKVILELTR